MKLVVRFLKCTLAIFAFFALSACEKALPELTNLASLTPLLFNGSQTKAVTISNVNQTVSVTAECSKYTESAELSFDNGVNWVNVQGASAVSTMSNNCSSSGQFIIALPGNSTELGFTPGVGSTKSVLVRATLLGELSDSSTINITYAPVAMNLTNLSSDAGTVAGSNFKLKYSIGAAVVGKASGSNLKVVPAVK